MRTLLRVAFVTLAWLPFHTVGAAATGVAAAREAAEQREAALLAPGAYAAGIAAQTRADAAGADAALGERLLAEARAQFEAATLGADVARQRFAAPLASREQARTVEAVRLAGPQWARAESTLMQAAQRLERGDDDGADARAAAARKHYDAAALQAVQATVLTAARSKILELDAAAAARYAPRTAARARELLDSAEAELAADSSRRRTAERLAGEALETAGRALAIAAYLRDASKAGATEEDLVAYWQAALERAAAAAGTRIDATAGPAAASDALASELTRIAGIGREQANELEQRNRQVTALEEEIRELDNRLASAGSEARALGERLEARERVLEQFNRLERAFPAGNAVVLRKGDAIILRLTGLVFDSGSAQLPKSASALLASLGEVVNIYPRASFDVEGHTDSSGDSAANQQLSQRRADAVRSYMTGTLGVAAGLVSAVGYGDSRPIANNATTEGRRENRRIDIVIDTRESTSP
jgi:outer membrane protein OmpA-like peptidoglycan-associated protein